MYALDALNELAAALNDNENYAASITTALSTKQNNLTFGINNNDSVVIDSEDISINDYAKFTSNGIKGRNFSEIKLVYH